MFEDGTPFVIPGEANHPPPLDVPDSARNVLVYLALPTRQAGAVEVADAATEGRYTRAIRSRLTIPIPPPRPRPNCRSAV